MTAVFRVLDIMVSVIFSHLPIAVMTWAKGVEGGALLALRWRTRQSREDFGHTSTYPEALWPIFLSLTLLFCVINESVTNVAALRSASVDVSAKMIWPQLKDVSSLRKGALSSLDLVSSVLSRIEEEKIRNYNYVALRLEDGAARIIGNA